MDNTLAIEALSRRVSALEALVDRHINGNNGTAPGYSSISLSLELPSLDISPRFSTDSSIQVGFEPISGGPEGIWAPKELLFTSSHSPSPLFSFADSQLLAYIVSFRVQLAFYNALKDSPLSSLVSDISDVSVSLADRPLGPLTYRGYACSYWVSGPPVISIDGTFTSLPCVSMEGSPGHTIPANCLGVPLTFRIFSHANS